jgi:uncharacterized protein (TIGR02246 family)
MIDETKARAFAARYTAAWCSRDPASVAAFYSPSGSLTINDAEPSVGRAAIAEAARAFMTAFPDLTVLMDDLRSTDGNTEYHWTLVGTNSGPGGTGMRIRIAGSERWRFGDDGLIERSLGSFDAALYAHQLEHGIDE